MFIKITGVQRQIIISLSLYVGQLIIGYSSSWAAPVIPKLRDLEQSPLPYLLTEAQLAIVASCMYLGGVPGPYLVLWLSNVTGRKPCLLFGGVLFVIAYIVLATANNLASLIIGRLLVGASSGAINIANLVYIGEIASASIRGILLTTIGVFNTVGSILLFATGPYVSYQWTTYIALVAGLVFITSVLFIPDTPIFYALQGRDEELRKILQDLDRLEEIDELLETKKDVIASNTKREWLELFTNRCNRKSLFIVLIINIFQNASGVMGVVFFSAAIFDMAGSSIESGLAMIIIGCFQLLGSTVTPIFIESTGRKKILMMSSALCSFSMFILGLYFYLDHVHNPVIGYIKWLPLVVLILFYIGYDSGLGIIPNAIIGEMFTPNVRSKGSTLAMTMSWIFGFLVTTAFGTLLETVGGYVAFWFFSCICACAILFTFFFIPETKGKSLLEIQKIL